MGSRLKHDLSLQSKILRDRKAVLERQRINSMFYTNPKNVYREFRKDGKVNVENAPSPPPPQRGSKAVLGKHLVKEGNV